MTRHVEVDESYSFWNRQLEALGDRDPVESMAATPERLRELFAASDDALRRRPAPGKWSALEVLGHLLDTEWILGFRVQTILGDENPLLQPCEQDRWVEIRGYNQRRPDEVLDLFAAMRKVTVDTWRRVSEEQLERVGTHAEAKMAISLRLIRGIQAGHDLVHLQQIQRCLAA